MFSRKVFVLRFIGCILFSFSFLAVVTAQEVSFAGSLSTQFGVGLPSTHDNEGRFLVGTTTLDTTLKAYIGDSSLVVNSQLLYDALGGQSSNGTESFVALDGSFALKLKEAYFDYNGGSFAIRVGRQISAWGKADAIQVADILCPQDNSVMIAANYKESRIGIDAVRFSYMRDLMQIDAYWIPFFTPSTLPLAKGNPLRAIEFPDSYSGYKFYTPQSWDDFDLSEKKLSNSEYALRFSANFSKFDFSFYWFYGWDDTPFFSYAPVFSGYGYSADLSGINLSGSYERLLMFGADAAVPFGNFVFRFEAAYFPERYMQTSVDYQKKYLFAGEKADAAKERHQLVGLIGADWDAGGGWTLMAQYVADIAFGDVGDLARKQYVHQLTATVTKSLFNDLLSLMFHGGLDLCDFSAAIDAEAEYSLTDSIKLSLIGNFYIEGPWDEKGMYGVYRDLSCLTLKGKISF
ncbi:MAG: hypothetical protein IJP61_11355 [Treponema sp.]|nr:hypothetical protein [Treponema sp.]